MLELKDNGVGWLVKLGWSRHDCIYHHMNLKYECMMGAERQWDGKVQNSEGPQLSII